jgi:DNA-directed RNA polymerase beta' subunit
MNKKCIFYHSNDRMDDKGQNYGHIKSIKFSVWSSDVIKRMSACKVDSKALYGPNSVSDPKLGRLENDEICPTCGEDSKTCPSHFGHIELNVKIVNPLYIPTIVHVLKIFCWHCSSALISRDKYELLGFMNKKNTAKIKNTLEITSKIHKCPVCEKIQPLFNENKTDKIITMYPNKEVAKKKQKNQGVVLTGEDISEMFSNIADEDVELIGLDIHPRDFIISNLPVLPPKARPFIIDQGKLSEDDLTHKYPEIVKMNHRINNATTAEERKKAIVELEFHVKTLFDNSQGKAKLTKDRPMKSIKQRLNGKDGLFRGHLMGKRVDESWRTVIGPDPTLRIDEMALPREICDTLRQPVKVFKHNKKELEQKIYDGNVSTIVKNNKVKLDARMISWTSGTRLLFGDKVKRGGKILEPESTLKFVLKEGDVILRKGETGVIEEIPVILPQRKPFSLEIGDTVYRKVENGDTEITNRQPSLHRGSMMGFKIVQRPGKTARLPLQVTGSFNADFDPL